MKTKSVMKTILRAAVLVLCGGILGFNLYTANAGKLLGNALPMPFGYGAAVVLSGSMEPTLSKGDLILVRKLSSPKKDQIVVYQDGASLVVHRIVETCGDEIITQGDANHIPDDPVSAQRIKGEVICSVPFLGTLVQWIRTPLGTVLVLGAAILLVELSGRKEKKKDDEELERIKEEIRKLKAE